jgi:hypothetical protein
MIAYCTLHAIARFQQRVAELPDEEARQVILASLEELVAAGLRLPGRYEPEHHIPVRGAYDFRAVVRGARGQEPLPIVVTILWWVREERKEKRQERRRKRR